jgi:adenylylsulfate kinase
MIVMMAGLSGTGKSTLAQRLAEHLPGIVLNKDPIRAALFPPGYVEYTTEQDDFVIGVMLQTADYLLTKHPALHILLDGRPYSKTYQVEVIAAFADRLGVPLRIIECVASDAAVKGRIERDLAEGTHPAANRTFEMYLNSKARFQPIERPKLVVNTEQPIAACLEQALAYLRGSP